MQDIGKELFNASQVSGDPDKIKYDMAKSGEDKGLILPYNGLDQKNTVLLPDTLGNLKYIFQDILDGNEEALNRPEFKALNFNNIKAAIEWLAKTNSINDIFKNELLAEGWRLNFKCKPPTPEEFLTERYLGPTAETLYEPVRKAFIEFMNPLGPYRNAILSLHIGWGKAQPYSSLVATDYEEVMDFEENGIKFTFRPDDMVLEKNKFVKAKDARAFLPQPTNLIIMSIYDCRSISEFSRAFEIETYDELIAFFNNFNEDYMKNNEIVYHKHHIIPRSEGGTDNDGLVCLPLYFHIKAHYLRATEYERANNKLYAYKNYNAVCYMLGIEKLPDNYRDFLKELDISIIAQEKRNAYRKTFIYVSKDNECIRIPEELLDEYLKNGYEKKRVFKSPKGKVWVNNGIRSFYILETELDNYLKSGYSRGMYKTEKMSQQNHKTKGTSNTIWIIKDNTQKCIDKNNLSQFLSEGWSIGRNFKPALGTKGKPHKKRGLHWYNNGIKEVLAISCPEGYQKGMLHGRKENKA